MHVDPIIAATFAGLFGAVFGSFASTVAIRTAHARDWILGRSLCDSCGSQLKVYDLVPVVSFLLQRGACRRCKSPISPTHFGGETAGAAIGVISFLCNAAMPLWVSLCGWLMLAAALIDIETLRLPDGLNLTIGGLGILHTWVSNRDLLVSITTALLVSLMLLSCRYLYYRLKGRWGLGLGDVKFVGAASLWLGPYAANGLLAASLFALVCTGGAALLTGERRLWSEALPFGPYLAGGYWLLLLVQAL